MLSVGYIRNRRVGNVAECRLPDELIERYSGIVDAITPAKGGLVIHPIGEAKAWPPCVVSGMFKGALSSAARAFSREQQRSRQIAGSRGFGVLGSKLEYRSCVSVRANW